MYEYYRKKICDGKTNMQAVVSVMRKLVDIIYSMMKNKPEYIIPEIQKKKLSEETEVVYVVR